MVNALTERTLFCHAPSGLLQSLVTSQRWWPCRLLRLRSLSLCSLSDLRRRRLLLVSCVFSGSGSVASGSVIALAGSSKAPQSEVTPAGGGSELAATRPPSEAKWRKEKRNDEAILCGMAHRSTEIAWNMTPHRGTRGPVHLFLHELHHVLEGPACSIIWYRWRWRWPRLGPRPRAQASHSTSVAQIQRRCLWSGTSGTMAPVGPWSPAGKTKPEINMLVGVSFGQKTASGLLSEEFQVVSCRLLSCHLLNPTHVEDL